jgi:hypothetical protein
VDAGFVSLISLFAVMGGMIAAGFWVRNSGGRSDPGRGSGFLSRISRAAVGQDLRKMARTAVQAGLVALVVYLFVGDLALLIAGLTALVLGLVLYGVVVPADGETAGR